MKYVNPMYKNESVEICDAIQASTVSVAYVNKGTGVFENGEEIVVKATQVTVDVSGLF